MGTDSALADAQHEAAHVVVGSALGLRLIRAWIGERVIGGKIYLGMAEWHPKPWPREADLLMTAAGIAWERRSGGDLIHASGDVADLRRAGIKGNARIRVLERAAWALLVERQGLHARITRALLDGEVTGADLRRIARAPGM